MEAAPQEQEGEAASSGLAPLEGLLSLSPWGQDDWAGGIFARPLRSWSRWESFYDEAACSSKEASAELYKGTQEGREGSDFG